MKVLKSLILIMVVLSIISLNASATLLVYEGFDYGDSTLDGQNGGTGFSDAWSTTDTVDTQSTSLSTPDGYGLTVTGGSIADVAGSGAVTLTRTLSSEISMDPTEEQTYYFSVLFCRYDTSDSTWGEYSDLLKLVDAGGDFGVIFQTGSDEEIIIDLYHSTTTSEDDAFALGQTYLYVGKIVVRDGEVDEAYASLYEVGSDTVELEPASWDISVTVDCELTSIDTISLKFGQKTDTFYYDELRIGTTWADVTGVPEPSSLFLLGISSLCLFRRRKNN
jgi:hypothetical protein